MLSPQLRQKVFNLWTMFWSSGMTNPLVSIEQITYLLFLKQLESLDTQRIKDGKPSLYGPRRDCKLLHPKNSVECPGHDNCRWSNIREDPTYDLFSQYVFPWLRELDETLKFGNGAKDASGGLGQGMMSDAYFQFPREKTAMLQQAIKAIDDLFPQGDARSSDLMGDIFEYLLDEIQQSGKNGQFRTPRHITRFMVDLLAPDPANWKDKGVVDPAAGSGGFLLATIQYLLRQATQPDVVRMEADGTPHRLSGGTAAIEKYLNGDYFTGYDNDRTMVRIGWMNLVLHGIESPHIERRDSLGKGLLNTESGVYDLVLANPPFTGNVDKSDLHERRIPRDPQKDAEPITTKSELLFIWLILDLLRVGGRAAVIVPEGVLFGSTNAHRELRRCLLFEHDLQAVISLPAGVFQPYTGVKTSVLVFQKVGAKTNPGDAPYTKHVWFYEVQADGYSLDARRQPQPEPNDLWDALTKWPERVVENLDYFKPAIYPERWRVVDTETLKVFPDLAMEQGKVRGIHELFTELPADPDKATKQVIAAQKPIILDLCRRYLRFKRAEAAKSEMFLIADQIDNQLITQIQRDLRRWLTEAQKRLLDTDYEQHGLKELRLLWKAAVDALPEMWEQDVAVAPPEEDWQAIIDAIVHEFAKLDGFDLCLRTLDVQKSPNLLDASRSWAAPVRAYTRDDDWQSADGALHGTHDETGQVRLQYLNALAQAGVFDETGAVKAKHLDKLTPDCLEANEFNLSAGRYKPFARQPQQYDPPATILRTVYELESQLLAGIDELLKMVEGVE